MKSSATPFIHILVFQCPECERPVVEWLLSSLRNPESIDAATLDLKCSCGWSAAWLGARARRHLVLGWPSASEPSSDPDDPAGPKRDAEESTDKNKVEGKQRPGYTEHFMAAGGAVQLSLPVTQLHRRHGDM
jgi:hypothetical protein